MQCLPINVQITSISRAKVQRNIVYCFGVYCFGLNIMTIADISGFRFSAFIIVNIICNFNNRFFYPQFHVPMNNPSQEPQKARQTDARPFPPHREAERMLIETSSPYLVPTCFATLAETEANVPLRLRRYSSAFLRHLRSSFSASALIS